MNFKVFWLPPSRQRLTEIWLGSVNRDMVTLASTQIDPILSRDPLAVGESRAGDDRVRFHDPLMVSYTVDTINRRVFVNNIRAFGKHA